MLDTTAVVRRDRGAEPTVSPLLVARLFTVAGRHPFDEAEWERRTIITKAMDGTQHEEKNCEFPVFWSVNASNIAGSKYFRGRLGSDARERSVRQIIGRVTAAIRGWGLEFGYFSDESSADAFADELAHLLLYQKAAFNSPVWFNVGVDPKPQCSACFILEVEDTMESILDWYYTEGLIFRGGSGSGVDLSPLRSSREKLSRGGYSSGPVSFMRGADSVAGAIASGGSTRRAAKMVVLRVDHPDILPFVRCKAEEEKKVRALMASGYEMTDLNNDGWKSIQYQNANNSVRVPDEFMRAVEEDGPWSTRLVKTGEVSDEFRARELLREIAQAAWECGDPGMQFDTTINDWNTAAVTGRITATNPCVTGETPVATREGWREIRDLVGTMPMIATPAGWQQAVRVWQTGIKPVYQLTTRSGYTLRLTAEHRVAVSGRGDVPLHALERGDVIQLQGAGFGLERIPADEAFAIGYGVGDGCIFTAARTGASVFTATGGEDDRVSLEAITAYINTAYREPDRLGRSIPPVHVTSATMGLKVASSRPHLASRLAAFATLDRGSEGKRFRPRVFGLDEPSQAALLRGLFTADGTISGNAAKGYYVGLDSTAYDLLRQVQLLLLNFGIKAKLYTNRKKTNEGILPDSARNPRVYPVQALHSLRITRSSRLRFERAIGFAPESAKAVKLSAVNRSVGAYRDELTDEVRDIQPDGIEPVYDLTEPVSSHFVAGGVVVHNCAEYIHLNNSACNLASINLLKFLREDGTFAVEEFRHAVRVMILAQDILVDGSSYPTEKIAKNARDFRELGLGYANLGALLMALGMPYDSEPACATAAAVTALMCGEAYRYSGVIAQAMGPFAGFAVNREPMRRVLGKHRAALARVRRDQVFDARIYDAAAEAWEEALGLGETGVRNSQVTLIAPTGTISFMMDCDTTGIEPDFALVKMKTLVGGGVMKIANRTVPRALRRLGYAEPEVADIIGYIEERGTIEGAPHLRDGQLEVFDCAVKPAAGSRAISWQGHVRMVAAVQPFVSGGISKTFNMPHETTVEEIMEAYLMAWRMGIKVFAVYRDGSKAAQPLVTLSGKGGGARPQQALLPIAPARRRLPPTRGSETHKFSVAGHEGYLTYGMYEDGSLAEMFIRMHKTGSTMSGLLDAFAITVSIALQHGVPLKELARKFIYGRYEPAGFTQNPDIQIATSITDYIFRYLSLRFLAPEELAELGMNGHAPSPAETIGQREVPQIEATEAMPIYADSVCRLCGGMMIQTGSCKTCLQCGTTNGGC